MSEQSQTVSFTLVQAAKLRNRIQGRLEDLGQRVGRWENVSVTVNDTVDTSSRVVTLAREEALKEIGEFTFLANALYIIRLRISLANTESGISDLLARLTQLKVQQSVFRKLSKINRYQLSPEDLLSRIEGQKANNISTPYAKDHLVVPILTQEDVVTLYENSYAIDTEIDSVQSELDRTNAITKIDFDATLIGTLKLYKII